MDNKINRMLVTGGAGFIGSHTVDRLVAEGRQVLVLDNLSTGSLENLAPYISDGSVRFVKGDISDRSLLSELMGSVEAVFHLAALLDHEECLRNPQLADQVNHRATIGLLEEARKHAIQRFVYASSAAVYGDASRMPITEDCELAPLNPYGASKLAGERKCIEYWQTCELRTICLRYFNVFGPRQSSRQYSGVTTAFMRKLNQGQAPTIYGDGLQTRDFVHVSDVATANILALDSDRNGEVYNIASGRQTTINALAQNLIDISGQSGVTPVHTSERQGEIRDSVADIRKARTQLRYSPQTDLQIDLADLWNWYTQNRCSELSTK
jgi:UDP-glucose 4-epimerase